jgi:hypothetical protein
VSAAQRPQKLCERAPAQPGHVCTRVCDWEPFTAEQKQRLALLFRPGVIAVHTARRGRDTSHRGRRAA